MSKMLLSAEAWHRLFQYQIEKLEEVDKSFLRQLFNAHSKTPIECLYSESGSIPIRIQISIKRLMYWWEIVSVDESELKARVYSAQKLAPISGDWVKMLENDKKQFDIELTDLEMSTMSYQKFKSYVKKKSKEVAIEYLDKLQRKHSKSELLDVSDL